MFRVRVAAYCVQNGDYGWTAMFFAVVHDIFKTFETTVSQADNGPEASLDTEYETTIHTTRTNHSMGLDRLVQPPQENGRYEKHEVISVYRFVHV